MIIIVTKKDYEKKQGMKQRRSSNKKKTLTKKGQVLNGNSFPLKQSGSLLRRSVKIANESRGKRN